MADRLRIPFFLVALALILMAVVIEAGSSSRLQFAGQAAQSLDVPTPGQGIASLAVLTLHHWADWRAGVDEMKRVANRQVVFTFDTSAVGNFWLTEAYFPEIVELYRGRCPSVAEMAHYLGDCKVDRVPIAHDCVDGFLGAFWRRPEAYLDPRVRAGISGFALLDQDVVARGIARLEHDLESGAWERRFGDLRSLDAIDVCYRLLVTA